MSAITYLTSIVTQLTNRFNSLESNSKNVHELPMQSNLEPTSKIPVSRSGVSEHITVQQLISSIQNSNYNKINSIGSITIDSVQNKIIIEPLSGTINGNNYQTTSNTEILITLCDTGFNRKDILVLTTNNSLVVISGEQSNGSIVIAPPVPLDALYITEFDVSDTVIGNPEEPTLGAAFVKKTFARYYNSTITGINALIPFHFEGNSEVRLTSPTLTSVAGFDLSDITGVNGAESPHSGKTFTVRNLTGNDVVFKHQEVTSPFVSFYFNDEQDLVVPAGQTISFHFNRYEMREVFRSWATRSVIQNTYNYTSLPTTVEQVLSTTLIPANTFKDLDLLQLKGLFVKPNTNGVLLITAYLNTSETLVNAKQFYKNTQVTSASIRNYLIDSYISIIRNNKMKGSFLAGAGIRLQDHYSSSSYIDLEFSFDPTIDNYLITTVQLSNSLDVVTQEALVLSKIN